MVVTTFSSSAQCGYQANIYNVGAYSRPTATAIDEFRQEAYNCICRLIGYKTAADDTHSVAKTVETQLVGSKIKALLKGDDYDMQLTKTQQSLLVAEFGFDGSLIHSMT